jgi:hypothetical protein
MGLTGCSRAGFSKARPLEQQGYMIKGLQTNRFPKVSVNIVTIYVFERSLGKVVSKWKSGIKQIEKQLEAPKPPAISRSNIPANSWVKHRYGNYKQLEAYRVLRIT